MRTSNLPITIAWLGDLHLTEPGLPNHQAAEKVVAELNELVRPDFVQFAGDNVQHARSEEFQLFNDLRAQLKMPHYVLVGDHDVHADPEAKGFSQHVGELYGSTILRGVRFIRLNSLDHRPLGFSTPQLAWIEAEVNAAQSAQQRIVLFQHHFPYKVWEQFDGPGIDGWRRIVQTRRIEAIFCGHTHYGQIANDGRNISIATRSIGDPEGGPAGYSLIHVCDDDLAVTYRTIEGQDPIVLVTHPRELILATGPRHIVSHHDNVEVRVWSHQQIVRVTAQVDARSQFDLKPVAGDRWSGILRADGLSKGKHTIIAKATDALGVVASHQTHFMFDPTGRYTPIPTVEPIVEGTAFC